MKINNIDAYKNLFLSKSNLYFLRVSDEHFFKFGLHNKTFVRTVTFPTIWRYAGHT